MLSQIDEFARAGFNIPFLPVLSLTSWTTNLDGTFVNVDLCVEFDDQYVPTRSKRKWDVENRIFRLLVRNVTEVEIKFLFIEIF